MQKNLAMTITVNCQLSKESRLLSSYINGDTLDSQYKLSDQSIEVHLLYDPRNIMPCVGTLMEETSHVCLNFQLVYQYWEYVETVK
jgi:hypothetical protein